MLSLHVSLLNTKPQNPDTNIELIFVDYSKVTLNLLSSQWLTQAFGKQFSVVFAILSWEEAKTGTAKTDSASQFDLFQFCKNLVS